MSIVNAIGAELDKIGVGVFDETGLVEATILIDKADDRDDFISVMSRGGDYDLAVHEEISNYSLIIRKPIGEEGLAGETARTIADHLRTLGYSGSPILLAEGTDYETRVVYIRVKPPVAVGVDGLGRPEWGIALSVRHTA